MADLVLLKRSRRAIRQRYNALVNLSGRILANPHIDEKIARLVRRDEENALAIEASRLGTIKRYPSPEGEDASKVAPSLVESRELEFNAYLDEIIEVRPTPEKLRLNESDMPKAIKLKSGEMDDTNRTGLAGIISDLGPDIYPLVDEDD